MRSTQKVRFFRSLAFLARGGTDRPRIDPASYLSVALPGVPNFWVVNGPQGCGANGSILPVLEQT